MEDGPRVGLCLEVLHEVVGPRRRMRTDMQRPAAKPQDSSVRLGFRVVLSPRQLVLLLMPLTGAALLVAAEFSTLYDVRVVTAVPEGGAYAAGPHHGYAQAVIAAG